MVHNASIMNAVGCCGLQLYHFGEMVSIPFWTDTWRPDSFLDKIEANLHSGLHTLCLLGAIVSCCLGLWGSVIFLFFACEPRYQGERADY